MSDKIYQLIEAAACEWANNEDIHAQAIIDAINASGTHRIVPAAEIEKKDALIARQREVIAELEGELMPIRTGKMRLVETAEIEAKAALAQQACEASYRLNAIAQDLRKRLAGVDAGTHQIVPKEPTFFMIIAGDNAAEGRLMIGVVSGITYTPTVWRAMLAAAPAEGEKE